MLYQCELYLLKAIRDFTTKYSVCRVEMVYEAVRVLFFES